MSAWAADSRVLPIYVTWSHSYGLTHDGQIWVRRYEDLGNDEETRCFPQTPCIVRRIRYVNLALVQGAARYEWLAALRPLRPSDALDCGCGGRRHPTSGVHCGTCGGAGWIPVEYAVFRGDRTDVPTELARYLVQHYSGLLTDQERTALQVARVRAKAARASPKMARLLMDKLGAPTDPAAVGTLPDEGCEAFQHRAAGRLLREHYYEILVNRCGRCGEVTATPRARQCRTCGHQWHGHPCPGHEASTDHRSSE